MTPHLGRRADLLRRTFSSLRSRIALALLSLWLLAALFGPLVAPWPSLSTDLADGLRGARGSAVLVVLVLGLAVPTGWGLGLLAGAGGRGRDGALARVLELASFWPAVVLVPLLATSLALPRPLLLGLLIAIGESCRIARLVRGELRRRRAAPYVLAARALGASRLDVLRTHVVPHSLRPLLVAAAFAGATTVALDSALAFLGLEGPDPRAWGGAIAHALTRGTLAVWPLLGVLTTTASFWVLAEALDDALDPRPRLTPE